MTATEDVQRQCQEIVDRTVRPSLRWYEAHSRWPRYMHRGSGLLVILGGLLLPVIAATMDPSVESHRALLSVVSFLVAALTSLNAFFRWDVAWRGRMSTALKLRGLLNLWELRIAASQFEADPARAAFGATTDLVREAGLAVDAETGEFFANVNLASLRTSGPGEP